MKYTFLNPTNGTELEGTGPTRNTVARELGIQPPHLASELLSPWLLLKVTDDNGAIVWLSNVTL